MRSVSDYLVDFKIVDNFLISQLEYWQFNQFEYLALPWKKKLPALCDWLDNQTLERLAYYKSNPHCLADDISVFLPQVKDYAKICHLEVNQQDFFDCDCRILQGIPGRKYLQIERFNAALDQVKPSNKENWLEWCSGKGYLGRVLAKTRNAKITSLEWNEDLCHQGQAFSDKHHLGMQFIHADAFATSSLEHIEQHHHLVALHACGDLHSHLIKHAVTKKTGSIHISPCCYHLIKEKTYKALSDAAKKSKLTLSRQCLKLPLQETVTAGKSVQHLRYLELSYRLGFDLLQRDLQKKDHYLSVPNVQKSLLKEGFENFCLWALDKKQLNLAENIDFNYYEQKGKERIFLVEQMETIQSLFRRPLELWLAYDRVLFLAENDFQVKLTQFCERELTPRNLLIQAVK